MNSDLLRSLAEHLLTTEGRALAGDAERVEAVCGGLLIARERISDALMALTVDYLGDRVFAVARLDGFSSVLRHATGGAWQRALWDSAPGWQAAVKGGGVVRH